MFTYLKEVTPSDLENSEASAFKKVLQGLGQSILGTNIKWNFTKFLVDQEGNVVARYSPTYKPEEIDSKIAELLNK